MRKLVFIAFLFCFVSCREDKQNEIVPLDGEQVLLATPQGFPNMEFPEGNELTKARWDLGKRLFYEKRLSIDNSISCGTCHQPALAFADDKAFSPGVFNRPGLRNAPSLANVGYHPYLLREGSVPSLEMQVLVPIQEHNEFNHNIVNIVSELKDDSSYSKASLNAYDRTFDGYVLTRAISLFQRTMVSGNSAYDKLVNHGDANALDVNEKEGMNLFFSNRTNCASCHTGFNFTNYSFANNGLDSVYADNGRFRLTNDSADEATFKIPSLRNVGLTAPYMHDGRFSTLEEVVEHYNSGGKNHKNKSHLIKPLQLSTQEKADLVAFLNSLTDYDFVNDQKWKEEH